MARVNINWIRIIQPSINPAGRPIDFKTIKIIGLAIRKEIIGEIIGFDRIENSEASEFISNLTGDNSKEVVSFGTEAGLFQEIGISTVVCGPGSIEQAHKIDEFIILDELKKCLKLLEGIKEKSSIN